MLLEVLQNYMDVINGATRLTQRNATAMARSILTQAGMEPAADMVHELSEQLIAAQEAQYAMIRRMIQSEVNMTMQRMGLPARASSNPEPVDEPTAPAKLAAVPDLPVTEPSAAEQPSPAADAVAEEVEAKADKDDLMKDALAQGTAARPATTEPVQDAIVEAPVEAEKPKAAPVKTTAAKSTPAKTTAAKSPPAKTTAAKSTPAKTTAAKSTPAKTTAAKSTPAKTTAAKSTPAKTTAAKSTPAKSAPAKKAPAKTTAAKTTAAGTTAAKSTPAKTTARKTAAQPRKTTEDGGTPES